DWSWTPVFLDVDLDGFEDLLISTGHELDSANVDVTNHAEEIMAAKNLSALEKMYLRKMYDRLELPKVAFRNRGDLTFEDVSAAWGFGTPGVSHGMCLADLDGDGDLDVVMNNLNGAAGVYRNEGVAPRVAVRLKGQSTNTRGIGAKIWLYGGAVPLQSQEMICGGRYLSSDDPMRVVAAGSLTNEMRIEVKWRSGAAFDKVAGRDQTGVLGTDVGLLVGSANYEDGQANGGCVRIYDVKRRVSGESVLGQEFSAGPLALADVDGDGDLDLFVGGRVLSGRYPAPADSLLLNNEGGRLMVGQRFEELGLVMGAMVSDLDGDGMPEWILACGWV